ncbi:MAG: portal protein [Sulfuricellaceae bacterium]
MAIKEQPEVIRRMMANFKLSEDASSENRRNGLDAMKFRRGGKDQWDTSVYTMFGEQNKPRESYNQIPQFVHQVTNEMRINMPQTRFAPGTNGSEKVAEVYEDLARAIQSTSEAEVAYDIAADSQVTIGWGYWRYLTKYENDMSFDQIIVISAVPNAFMIYDDPGTREQDKSDRRWLIEVSDIPLSEFNTDYKKDLSLTDLESIGDSSPKWATNNSIRVAEYWEVEHQKKILYRDAMGVVSDQPPIIPIQFEQREVMVPVVKWYKCNAVEVLEEATWPGKYIPYVFVAGETLNVDGQIYYTGIVEGMMAPQRQYNYWLNSATEVVALAPKAPFIGAVGQFEGLEKFWDNANIKNYPWLPYKPITINGTLAPAPQRNSPGADISSILALVQQAQNNFYTTTGIYPASLGQQSNEKSGKAIIARQKEGDVSTFHFQDNLARAQRFGGRILADLFQKIYDGSRVLRLLKEDGTKWTAKVNTPEMGPDGQEQVLDMTTGVYDVAVTTGPSYTTKRQESAESMTQMAQAYPPLMQIAGPQIVRSFDWPGANEIAEAMERAMPPQLQTPPDMEDVPPQIIGKLQQQEQQIGQLNQALEVATAELQKATAEVESKNADIQLKGTDMQIKMEQSQMDAQIKMEELALKREELALKRAELELEHQRLLVEASKPQVSENNT